MYGSRQTKEEIYRRCTKYSKRDTTQHVLPQYPEKSGTLQRSQPPQLWKVNKTITHLRCKISQRIPDMINVRVNSSTALQAKMGVMQSTSEATLVQMERPTRGTFDYCNMQVRFKTHKQRSTTASNKSFRTNSLFQCSQLFCRQRLRKIGR